MIGHNNEYDAYRSEITHICGIVMAVDMLVQFGDISGAKIEVGCDGLSVLYRFFLAGEDNISCTQAPFDLLSGIET